MLPLVRNRSSWKFFFDNAGYSTPPGRVVCARDLARAEREAWERDMVVSWAPDDTCFCAEDDVTCRCETSGECWCEYAALYPGDEWGILPGSRPLASLSGICDADSAYQRVIAAELVLEVLAPEWRTEALYDALLARCAGRS